MTLDIGGPRRIALEHLHGSEGNPRRISDSEFTRLCYALEKRPDLMDARPLIAMPDGEVIAGNMRLRAARHLGWADIPTFVGDYTPDQRRESIALDNWDAGEWIPDQLAAFVADHHDAGGDMALLGFADSEVNELLKRANGTTTADPTQAPPDDPLIHVPSKATVGDVWRMGDHFLIVADALDRVAYERLFDIAGDPLPPVLVVTSPPYNQGIGDFKPSGMMKEGANPRYIERLASAYEDSKPEPEYQAEQVALLAVVADFVTAEASMFYNHKVRYRGKRVVHPLDWIRRCEPWAVRQEIIWHRRTSITQNARMFMPTDERIYWLTRGDDFQFDDSTEIKTLSSVWEGVGQGGEYKVSAPFPVELPSRAIRACSLDGQTVLDPYSGTGTTIMACEHLGRHGRGIEINPRYADVVIHRWEAYTNLLAEQVATAA